MSFELPLAQVENKDANLSMNRDVVQLHEQSQPASGMHNEISGKSAEFVKTGLLPGVDLDGPIKMEPGIGHPYAIPKIDLHGPFKMEPEDGQPKFPKIDLDGPLKKEPGVAHPYKTPREDMDGPIKLIPGSKGLGKISWDFSDHSNGSDGGTNPWGQPTYQGDAWHGKQHITPQEKLWNAEYEGLSPADKIKYNAENQAATKYQGDHMTWEISGKKGPEPAKPDLPEHDKISAKVDGDQKAIEKQVRGNMTPDELAKYEKAKADYAKAEAGSSFGEHVKVPPEVAAYNKKIAEATGLKTESEKDFIAGKYNLNNTRMDVTAKQ